MPIITTKEQVISNGVNLMYFSGDTVIDMYMAEEEYIIPLLSQDLYDKLLSFISNGQQPGGINYQPLLDRVRRALAPLAYWLGLASNQVFISDRGVGSFNSENMQGAHRWEFNELRNELESKACFAFERLIKFLYENAETYEWQPSEKYNLIFKNAVDFGNVYPMYQPWRSFESMRPLIKYIEDNVIAPAIGKDFFTELKDASDTDEQEKEAIRIIKIAVANLSIKKAFETLAVKQSPQGFTVLLGNNTDAANAGEQDAPVQIKSLMYTSAERDGMNAISSLKNYLNSTASGSVFTSYYNSALYTAPDTVTTDSDINAPEKPNFFL